MYVPKGFAHGFLSLSDETEVIYLVSEAYNKPHESGIIWSDPDLNINWPIEPKIMSEKDSKASRFKDIVFLISTSLKFINISNATIKSAFIMMKVFVPLSSIFYGCFKIPFRFPIN